MTKETFNRGSLSEISQEFIEPDKKTTEQLINTIRKLVYFDTKRTGIYDKSNALVKGRHYDEDIIIDGADSKYGKIKLRVYNTYLIDTSEDPLPNEDFQTAEVLQNDVMVFQARAQKPSTFDMDEDPKPDAASNNFKIYTYKPGSWILPILAMGAKKEIKKTPGTNKKSAN